MARKVKPVSEIERKFEKAHSKILQWEGVALDRTADTRRYDVEHNTLVPELDSNPATYFSFSVCGPEPDFTEDMGKRVSARSSELDIREPLKGLLRDAGIDFSSRPHHVRSNVEHFSVHADRLTPAKLAKLDTALRTTIQREKRFPSSVYGEQGKFSR